MRQTTDTTDSQMDALIEGSDRSERRTHASRIEDTAALSMTDALRDILREEARRDAARRS